MAADDYFVNFIGDGSSVELWFLLFSIAVILVIIAGVEKGIERVAKIMMPVLVVLAVVIAVYSMTRPGAAEGIKYFLVPNFHDFSIMTIVAAMGQMFYSLSIAMGILYTYGSYMHKDVDLERTQLEVGFFDSGIAVLAGLMIIPAVFAFSGGDPNALKAGAGLVFITLPKVFNSMDFGSFIGAAFFLMVFFAALTSNISILEACVSTLCDEFRWSRQKATYAMAFEALALGVPCSLGFGPWESVQIAGMGILDLMDFVAGSMLTPFAALLTCLLIGRFIGVKAIIEEIRKSSQFKLEGLFRVSIVWIAPPLLLIVFVSSVLAALGFIKM
jgi:NSS family neurotransmitter:Na+ symporter